MHRAPHLRDASDLPRRDETAPPLECLDVIAGSLIDASQSGVKRDWYWPGLAEPGPVDLEAGEVEERRLERVAADDAVLGQRSEGAPAPVEDVAVAAVPAGQVEAAGAAGSSEVDARAVARVVGELVARAYVHPNSKRVVGWRSVVGVVRGRDHDDPRNARRGLEQPAQVEVRGVGARTRGRDAVRPVRDLTDAAQV